jgi:hypothetical protein
MPPLAIPAAKRPRIAISNAQKKALRAWYFDSSVPKRTLADASTWWQTKYGYSLSSSTAGDILSAKNAFLDDESTRINLKSKSNKGAKWETLEEALGDWAIRFDEAHGTVSGDLLRIKATEFWQRLPEYQGLECPTWSDGWLAGFKQRFNFHRRRKIGEASSVEITEDIVTRMQEIQAIKVQYTPTNTYNMDETGFLWKKLPNSGLTTSSAGKKLDKTRITANLCCNEDGSNKLPIWFIGKAKRPRCFTENHVQNTENMGVFWRANSTAWMNYSIMLEWLYWFDSRVQCPVLLLMDNFGAHELAVQLIEESNKPLKWTRIEWFPENTTSVFQPLDQGIIQNWKCHVKKQLLQFLVTEFDAGRDYNKTHHVLRAVKWGIDAWDSVKTLTITNCWRKGFQNKAINDSPWTDSTELVQEIQATADILARNLRIQELIDINNFIDAPEERVVDSEEEITNQIVAHYSHEEDQELESTVKPLHKDPLP